MCQPAVSNVLFGAEQQFRVMIECVATDVATMMVDVTEIQGQVERASGSRLDSRSSPATGVKTALHKLVTKYAGGDVAERLLGLPAKPRRLVTYCIPLHGLTLKLYTALSIFCSHYVRIAA